MILPVRILMLYQTPVCNIAVSVGGAKKENGHSGDYNL